MTIKIYSTPICPYCHMLKDYLKGKNIPFEDINVATDEAAADEMVVKSGQMGVPVTIITTDAGEEKVIVGFDKSQINQLLGIN
ncbi:MAG TPA: glutaredoxin domain-containing protein [Patescibacteria group bacterium]|nr:glutaredoxin domain-containing protein [Patescibacteria group bacterium]